MSQPIQFRMTRVEPDFGLAEYELIINPSKPISWGDIWTQCNEFCGFLSILIPEQVLSYATIFDKKTNKIGYLPNWIVLAPIKSMILRQYEDSENSEVDIILDSSCIPEEVRA